MLQKIAVAGFGIILLASPLLASADTASDLQAKVDAILGQVRELQEQLASLIKQSATTPDDAERGIGAVVSPFLYPIDPAAICPRINRALTYGISGDDVSQLQKFLIAQGLLSSDSATGFFGPRTQAAVQKLQAANGIVSSVGPATTGWGAVGPMT